MATSTVITFTAGGQAEAMYRDIFPLHFLGELNVWRASEIKFNATTQKWDMYLVVPNSEGTQEERMVPEACGFHEYDMARKVEIEWLDAARLHDTHPLSPNGLTYLQQSRERNNA